MNVTFKQFLALILPFELIAVALFAKWIGRLAGLPQEAITAEGFAIGNVGLVWGLVMSAITTHWILAFEELTGRFCPAKRD